MAKRDWNQGGISQLILLAETLASTSGDANMFIGRSMRAFVVYILGYCFARVV